MKNLRGLLFLAAFCGLLPLSCEKCNPASCECSTSGPAKNFEIRGLDIKTVNPEKNFVVNDTSFYTIDSIAKSVFITEEQTIAALFTPGFSFISKAYACSPAEGRAVQSLLSVKITANEDIAYSPRIDSIKSGDDITNYFHAKWNSGYPHFFTEIQYLIKNTGVIHSHHELYLKLAEGPFKPTELKFDISLTFSDSSVFVFEDQSIRVK